MFILCTFVHRLYKNLAYINIHIAVQDTDCWRKGINWHEWAPSYLVKQVRLLPQTKLYFQFSY